MSTLIVPELDLEPFPTLGPQVCDFLEDRAVFGPGDLKGKPAEIDGEKRAAIYRAYEVFPRGHSRAGRRRFKRAALSWRKGTAKTEFGAWIAYAELHAEGPVRCDGFDAKGAPVGGPVRDPYIPMVAYTEDQVEELAYGALFAIVTEGPDADMFDAGTERIIRLSPRGRADGKAVPLAGSPNANDGARTTFEHFDETHRMQLPRLVAAHETMLGNLAKRPLADPWALETTTAGEPGGGSVAEKTHSEAEMIKRGEIENPRLFFFHRQAGPGHDLTTRPGRIAAVTEASGPAAAWSDLEDIAAQWERPGADMNYLERVWLNRWIRTEQQAFDPKRWAYLNDEDPDPIPAGSFVTVGFDGARFRDATAFIITDIPSGRQDLWGLWERPENAEDDWEVPEAEVTASLEALMARHQVWRAYCDPPHWTETVGSWHARWPGQVEEWWTSQTKRMSYAVRGYREAIDSGSVSHNGNADLARHIAAAGRKELNFLDDDGKRVWILAKQTRERKFDAAMAAVLSWQARLDALKAGAKPKVRKPRAAPTLIRRGIYS